MNSFLVAVAISLAMIIASILTHYADGTIGGLRCCHLRAALKACRRCLKLTEPWLVSLFFRADGDFLGG